MSIGIMILFAAAVISGAASFGVILFIWVDHMRSVGAYDE